MIALNEELMRFAVLLAVFALFTAQDFDAKTGYLFIGALAGFNLFLFYMLNAGEFGIFMAILIGISGAIAVHTKGDNANIMLAIVISSGIWTTMHVFSYAQVENFAPLLVIFAYGIFYGLLNIGFKSFFAGWITHASHNILLVMAERFAKQGIRWGDLI